MLAISITEGLGPDSDTVVRIDAIVLYYLFFGLKISIRQISILEYRNELISKHEDIWSFQSLIENFTGTFLSFIFSSLVAIIVTNMFFILSLLSRTLPSFIKKRIWFFNKFSFATYQIYLWKDKRIAIKNVFQ